MWESADILRDEINMDLVPVGLAKSVKHLNNVAETLIKNGLPMGIVLPMYSKRRRLVSEINDVCSSCGLDFRLEKSFSLYLHTSKSRRIIKIICKGCGKKFTCGMTPNITTPKESEDLSTLSNADTSANSTILANTSLSMLTTPKSTINTPRITSLQNSKKNTKKRRGSALQRLLQEEETESDRSLSAFLNSFASQ